MQPARTLQRIHWGFILAHVTQLKVVVFRKVSIGIAPRDWKWERWASPWCTVATVCMHVCTLKHAAVRGKAPFFFCTGPDDYVTLVIYMCYINRGCLAFNAMNTKHYLTWKRCHGFGWIQTLLNWFWLLFFSSSNWIVSYCFQRILLRTATSLPQMANPNPNISLLMPKSNQSEAK